MLRTTWLRSWRPFVVVLAVAALATVEGAQAAPGDLVLIPLSGTGTAGSGAGGISGDGSKVVFTAQDPSGVQEAYRTYVPTGGLVTVTSSSAGVPANRSAHVVIPSADTDRVAFQTDANNLHPDDSTPFCPPIPMNNPASIACFRAQSPDVFVKDVGRANSCSRHGTRPARGATGAVTFTRSRATARPSSSSRRERTWGRGRRARSTALGLHSGGSTPRAARFISTHATSPPGRSKSSTPMRAECSQLRRSSGNWGRLGRWAIRRLLEHGDEPCSGRSGRFR